MKIYTKTGDHGETGLLGGVRVSKTHPVIIATGAIDETNSLVGLARSYGVDPLIEKTLVQVQHDLFDLGSRVAACLSDSSRAAEFPSERAVELEGIIDQMQDKLPPLTAFILPSGSTSGSTLHLARAVCRRAESDVIRLIESGLLPDNGSISLQQEMIYLNRLSDLLFVLARYANQKKQEPETLWVVGRDK